MCIHRFLGEQGGLFVCLACFAQFGNEIEALIQYSEITAYKAWLKRT